jgi:hypothetical protein
MVVDGARETWREGEPETSCEGGVEMGREGVRDRGWGFGKRFGGREMERKAEVSGDMGGRWTRQR